jgi:hypothetical protein
VRKKQSRYQDVRDVKMAANDSQQLVPEWTDSSSTGVFGKTEKADVDTGGRQRVRLAAAAAVLLLVIGVAAVEARAGPAYHPPATCGGRGGGAQSTVDDLPWTAPVEVNVGATSRRSLKGKVRTTGQRKTLSSDFIQVAEYKGIPFAQPPLPPGGRFVPPRPPQPWTGVLEAAEYKQNCVDHFGSG